MAAQTLFDKIWDAHVVADLGSGMALLAIDRHIMHDLGGGRGLKQLRESGRKVRNPEMVFATPDHAVSSEPGRTSETTELSSGYLKLLREETARHGIRLFDLGEPGQGIVHVIGPELGLVAARHARWYAATATPARMAALGAHGIRHRLLRVASCAGHADAARRPGPSACASPSTARCAAGVHAQGPDAAPDRPARRRRRRGLGRRVRRAARSAACRWKRGSACATCRSSSGARFGMIAPDDTTLRLPGRPASSRPRARCGTRPSRTGGPCPRTMAAYSTARRASTSAPSPRRSPGAPARRT